MPQLIRERSVIYEDNSESIPVRRGVPQGGKLSPLLFIKCLDWILSQDEEIEALCHDGHIMAYADDVIVTVNDQSVSQVAKLINLLKTFGFDTNPRK